MPFINVQPQPTKYILDNYNFLLGEYGIISGAKNSGKSTFAYQLACDLAFGKSKVLDSVLLNQNLNTVYVSVEYGEAIIPCNNGYDAINLNATDINKFKLITTDDLDFKLFKTDIFAFIRKYINLGFKAFVIDHIGYITQYKLNNKKSKLYLSNENSVTTFFDGLKEVIAGQASVIFLQHTTKNGVTRGSARLTDFAQLYWQISTSNIQDLYFVENSTIKLLQVENKGKVKFDNDLIFSINEEKRYLFNIPDCDIDLYDSFPYCLIAGTTQQLRAFIGWYIRNTNRDDIQVKTVYEAITRSTRKAAMMQDKTHKGKGSYWVGSLLYNCVSMVLKHQLTSNVLDNMYSMHFIFNALEKVNDLIIEYNEWQEDDKLKLFLPKAFLEKALVQPVATPFVLEDFKTVAKAS